MSFWGMFRSRSAPVAAAARAEATVPPAYTVDAEMLTDVGCVRDHNEDCVSLLREQADGRPDRTLVIVADGMGGHNAGEVASALAVRLVEAAYPEMRIQPAENLKHALEQAGARP